MSDKWKTMKHTEKDFLKCKGPRLLKSQKFMIFLNARRHFDRLLRNLGLPRRQKIHMKVKIGDQLTDNVDTVLATWKHDFEHLYNPPVDNHYNNYFLRKANQSVSQRDREMAADGYIPNELLNQQISYHQVQRAASTLKK